MPLLTENQLADIVDMFVDDYGSRLAGSEISEIAALILENICGFETVDSQALTQTVNEIRKRYDESVEQHSEKPKTFFLSYIRGAINIEGLTGCMGCQARCQKTDRIGKF